MVRGIDRDMEPDKPPRVQGSNRCRVHLAVRDTVCVIGRHPTDDPLTLAHRSVLHLAEVDDTHVQAGWVPRSAVLRRLRQQITHEPLVHAPEHL